MVSNSRYKVLYLLAACQKYEMTAVQSSIRAEVRQGTFPAPTGAEAFAAYAIASGKMLIPEMKNAARQTLDHPMTFEILGEGLRLFEGWALQDLANFRKRYRDNLVSCFKSFLNIKESQFNIWTPCASYTYKPGGLDSHRRHSSSGLSSLSNLPMSNANQSLPAWLAELYQKHLDESQEAFSRSLFKPRSIRGEYLTALHAHVNSYSCISCAKVHVGKGETFCKVLEDRLAQALDKVCLTSIFSKELWGFKHAPLLGALWLDLT